MKTRAAAQQPRPLLVLGRVSNVADLALRRVLHARERGQALAVVDYQGHLASLLTERNKGNLHKGPLLWCDLANRRRPSAVFRFRQSPGMKPALRGFMMRCVHDLTVAVSATTIDLVVDLAYRLAAHGSVGLVSLVNCLRRPESFHTLRRDLRVAAELDQLLGLLDWLLRFSAVWSLSEGNNSVDVGQALAQGSAVWLEMPQAHFERLEHQVVSWMIDAVLVDALFAAHDGPPGSAVVQHPPIVMYGFPADCPAAFAIDRTRAKQVALYAFTAGHPLPAAAQSWLEAGADCWVAGDVGELPANAKTEWLGEAGRVRLRELQPGQVWVRSGVNQKAVTALVRPPESNTSLASSFRRQAVKKLHLTPVKQFSSALPSQASQAPQNADLYGRLCSQEALYAGWFRVKAHNRQSHGADRVTIEQFGLMLNTELAQLTGELLQGRYRCRPLRTTRIPKADGDFRTLKIACVRDRVVQAACLSLIEPIFDARFSPSSFAYRPGRNAHHAVALARAAVHSGKHWVVTADIQKCFDSIDHDILLRLVGDVIGDRDLLQVIRGWLATDVIDFMEIIPSEVGVAQGEAISPLLANIYLDPLDKEFDRTSTRFVRYADDYVVLCKTEAEAQAALRLMGEFLQDVLRMALKPAKTQYGRVSDDAEGGFGFLGFEIGLSDVRMPEGKVTRTVQTVGELVDTLCNPDSTSIEKCHTIMRMNALARGFRNYFLIDNAPAIRAQLAQMDVAVQALAGQRPALAAGVELLWESREKFAPATDAAVRRSGTSAEVSVLTGAYPVDRPTQLDPRFTAKEVDPAPNPPHAMPPSDAAMPIAGAPSSDLPTDPDILVLHGRLHVMTSGCYVTISGEDLLVRRRKKDVFRTALSDLTMVYLEGKGIALSSDLTMRLCEQDVPVVFTPLVGIPAAIAQPVQSTRSNVRQQQVLRRSDPDILKIGLNMLAAKVANQASVLKYFARYHKRKNEAIYGELTRCADDIRSIADTLDGCDPAAAAARASAMGHEGRAAAKYWAAFASLVPAELSFPGRHTRHATDPVNSAVNYIYGMLYGEVWRAVIRAGLDPYFGIIHGTERDQGSLVFDLIEEYRAPFGDRVVLGLLGRGLTLDLDKEGRLRATCRHKLVSAFHKQWRRDMRWRSGLCAPSDILEMQVASLKNSYLGKDEYRPFRFRW